MITNEFDYNIPPRGVEIGWAMTISGYEDEALNGDTDSHETLVDIEATMENFEDEYTETTGIALTRVRGAHGWREFHYANGAIHRFDWTHYESDGRCPRCMTPDNDLYMVTDELWAKAELDGRACFRCLERAIGRQLVPTDFKHDIPANDGDHHEPELRARMGYQ